MKKSIIMASLCTMLQNTNAAEQTQQSNNGWWGVRMETCSPSNTVFIRKDSILLNIADITGLSGIIRAKNVSIECPPENARCIEKLGLLNIQAESYMLNGCVIPCNPYQQSANAEAKTVLTFTPSQVFENLSNETVLSFSPTTTFIQRFECTIEHIKKNLDQLKAFAFKDRKNMVSTRWAFSQPFYVTMHTLEEGISPYKIISMSCYSHDSSKEEIPEDKLPLFLFSTGNLDILKERIRCFIKDHNTYIRKPSAFPDYQYTACYDDDVFDDYRQIVLKCKHHIKEPEKNYTAIIHQINLHIEPQVVPGEIVIDF